jgi:hypothetical protein
MMGVKRNEIMYPAFTNIIHSMNVRIINKELIKDESSRLVKIIRPVVQINKSGVWVTVKEFFNYFKEEAEYEAKKLYESLIKKEQNG